MTREETKKLALDKVEYYRSQGFACSEVSIRVLSDVFDCRLSDDFLRAVSVFSGGAAVDGRCGIAEASLAFISYLFGNSKANQAKLKRYARLVQKNMETDLTSIMCSDLFYPLYEEHKKKQEAEEVFHCVFWDGIVSVTGSIYDILYT